VGLNYEEARRAVFTPSSPEEGKAVRELARIVAAGCGCRPPRLLAGYAALHEALKERGDPIALLKQMLEKLEASECEGSCEWYRPGW
jgi:hypothetical protein